jgi:hypothetical protein
LRVTFLISEDAISVINHIEGAKSEFTDVVDVFG